MTALAAAVGIGPPPKVEIVSFLTLFAISGRAAVSPIGKPLASPLALVTTSGVTPHCSMPHHLPPVRPQPVCTSSLMKTPPCSRTSFATMPKYSLGGVMKPPTP